MQVSNFVNSVLKNDESECHVHVTKQYTYKYYISKINKRIIKVQGTAMTLMMGRSTVESNAKVNAKGFYLLLYSIELRTLLLSLNNGLANLTG